VFNACFTISSSSPDRFENGAGFGCIFTLIVRPVTMSCIRPLADLSALAVYKIKQITQSLFSKVKQHLSIVNKERQILVVLATAAIPRNERTFDIRLQ
jgi:hypothetical protein